MSHSALICRECYREIDLASVSDESEASAGTALACPGCGSGSVGV